MLDSIDAVNVMAAYQPVVLAYGANMKKIHKMFVVLLIKTNIEHFYSYFYFKTLILFI